MFAWGVLGLLLGAWFGALARLWMRPIVVQPDPVSWSGTFAIIISAASAIVGGWALAHRRPIWLAPSLAALWFAALPFIAYAVGDPDHHDQYDGVHYLSISVGIWTLAAFLAVGGREPLVRWRVARP